MHTHAPHAHLGKVDDIRWWAVARDDAVDSCEQGVGLLPAACSQDLLRAASSKRRPTCERTRCERHRGTAGCRTKWAVPWARQVTKKGHTCTSLLVSTPCSFWPRSRSASSSSKLRGVPACKSNGHMDLYVCIRIKAKYALHAATITNLGRTSFKPPPF